LESARFDGSSVLVRSPPALVQPYQADCWLPNQVVAAPRSRQSRQALRQQSTLQRFLRGSFASGDLVPEAHAEDKARIVGITAFLAREGCGLTERSRVRASEIRR